MTEDNKLFGKYSLAEISDTYDSPLDLSNSLTSRKDQDVEDGQKIQNNRKTKQKKEQKNLRRGESYNRSGIVLMYTFIFLVCVQ